MVSVLTSVKKFLKHEQVETDDAVFRLHYKCTAGILMTCSLLLSARQYFGDPITCEVNGVPSAIMDTYCWVTGTFTIPELLPDNVQKRLSHPGVGYFNEEKHNRIYHKYYQWVSLVLALTAVSFYTPRFLWKYLFEKGMMSHVCNEMRFLSLKMESSEDQEVKVESSENVELEITTSGDLERVKKLFYFYSTNRRINKFYYWKFLFCEILNFINVIVQFKLTDIFLDGEFSSYGHQFYKYVNQPLEWKNDSYFSSLDPRVKIFPTVSMCQFNMHGSTGDVMKMQGLCILPLNILNAKIYCLLWFWYVFLLTCSALGLIIKILIINTPLRSAILKSYHGMFESKCVDQVCKNASIGDWFVLRQISKNVDPTTFNMLIMVLSSTYDHGGNPATESVSSEETEHEIKSPNRHSNTDVHIPV